jgi:FkbM family methyltransferase
MTTPITTWSKKYNLRPIGVIHVGASLAEEIDEWNAITSRVAWIEPNPELWSKLESKIIPFGHELHKCAAGEKEGVLDFHVSSNSLSSSLLELGRHKDIYPSITYVKTVKVDVKPLDAIFKGRHHGFDLLYMDVQGYEGQVLLGASDLLPHLNWIYLEYNTEEMYKCCWLLPQMESWLGERGFKLVEKHPHHPAWGDALFQRK